MVGKVVSTSVYEIAIEREEPNLGKIVNHFPKVGLPHRSGMTQGRIPPPQRRLPGQIF